MAETLIRALVITASNRAAAGVYPDRSGPVLAELLGTAGCAATNGIRDRLLVQFETMP